MRVFVFEYVTGGGSMDATMVASLAGEGDMMLAAAVRDLLEVTGVEVIVMRDHRLELPDLPIDVHWVTEDWHAAWTACLDAADAVLPIAPETDGILERLCREARLAGCLLLNSDEHTVALAASKQRTLQVLGQCGISVVESHRATELPTQIHRAMVVKPDMGVGCQDIHLVVGDTALREFVAEQPDPDSWLVQPYVEGTAASLSLIVGDDCVCLLGANLQRVVQVDDCFVLMGCVVNGVQERREPLLTLAQKIREAMPGLFGYVGVDLVLTGDGPVVLEVNPRLTTSYVGLSRSTGRNIAELILQLGTNPSDLPGKYLQGRSVHIDLELGRVA